MSACSGLQSGYGVPQASEEARERGSQQRQGEFHSGPCAESQAEGLEAPLVVKTARSRMAGLLLGPAQIIPMVVPLLMGPAPRDEGGSFEACGVACMYGRAPCGEEQCMQPWRSGGSLMALC